MHKTTIYLAIAGLVTGIAIQNGRAQSPKTHVYIVPVFMPDAKTPSPQDLAGSRVVGISCISHPLPKAPDAAVCYVATSP